MTKPEAELSFEVSDPEAVELLEHRLMFQRQLEFINRWTARIAWALGKRWHRSGRID